MTYEEILNLTNDGVEIWKPIEGYENLYEISNFGNVKSLARWVKRGKKIIHVKEKILKSYIGKNGYYYTSLCKNGKEKLITIHRLVAKGFIPNPNNLPEIDHINTDRADYNLSNLRWVTHKENSNNDISLQNRRNNTYTKEVKNKEIETRRRLNSKNCPKTVYQYTKDGMFVAEYYSMEEARRKTGAGHIGEVLDNYTQTSGGFLWTSHPVEKIKYLKRKHSCSKAIQQYDVKTGKLLGEWNSINEASRATGIFLAAISRNLKTANPIKYKFVYK